MMLMIFQIEDSRLNFEVNKYYNFEYNFESRSKL